MVNDGVAGLLALPATPNTAVGVLPDWFGVVGLGPAVLVPLMVVVPNWVTVCRPKGTGNTSDTATP